jgi:Ala-tRNA(Pro) deacylase
MAETELISLLEKKGVPYELLSHEHTESALEEARALGVEAAEVAKTLVVKTDEGYVRVVLPASARIDLRKLRELRGVAKKKVHLASEDDLAGDYPEFELGAVPPVGGKRSDPVVIDSRLATHESLVLEAGSHDQSVRIATADLLRISAAEIADVCHD